MPNQSIEQQLIDWNIKFPLDREYRKANKVIFGSEQHCKINQIDIYLQHAEDELYKRFHTDVKEEMKMEDDYSKGIWFKEEKDVEGQEVDDLFAKLKIENISN